MRNDEKSVKLSEYECMKNSIKKVQEKHHKKSFKELENTNNFKENYKNLPHLHFLQIVLFCR